MAGSSPSLYAVRRPCGSGDAGGPRSDFRRFYDRWFADVLRWIRALGAARADHEEIARRVFRVARRRLESLDRADAGSRLYGITRRQVRGFRRRAWIATAFGRRSGRGPLHIILGNLSEARRATFVLFEIDGLSGDEIALVQDVPVNAVWRRLHQARRAVFKHAGTLRGVKGLPAPAALDRLVEGPAPAGSLEAWIVELVRREGPAELPAGRRQRLLLSLGPWRPGRATGTAVRRALLAAFVLLAAIGAVFGWTRWRPPASVRLGTPPPIGRVAPSLPGRTPSNAAAVEDPLLAEGMRALRLEGKARRARVVLARYLDRHPHGALSDEALALSIQIALDLHDPEAAVRLSARYLDQHPDGSFRPLAERTLAAARAPAQD